MSGGIAYVFDAAGTFPRHCNHEHVDLESLDRQDDVELVRSLVERHVAYTGSQHAARILRDWSRTAAMFVTVMPRDFKRAIEAAARTATAAPTLAFVEVNGMAVNG